MKLLQWIDLSNAVSEKCQTCSNGHKRAGDVDGGSGQLKDRAIEGSSCGWLAKSLNVWRINIMIQ